MRQFLLSISILCLTIFATAGQDEGTPSATGGERARYTAYIETPRAYISGILATLDDGDKITGCVFNEFGVSALSFSYDTSRHKVKILNIIKPLDHWYVKRVLRADLQAIMPQIQTGDDTITYTNRKRDIHYRFTTLKPIHDDEISE